jgi:molecular chaperone DnaK
VAKIKSATEELTKASHKLAEKMYQSSTPDQQEDMRKQAEDYAKRGGMGGEAGAKEGNDRVVDADYSVKDDEK